MVQHASIAEARAELSALVNKVAHGKRRVILTSRGRPKAALVSLEDLDALEDVSPPKPHWAHALEEADRLSQRVLARRGGVPLPSSADDLYAIREGNE